jgi:gluconolactonase
MTKHRRAFLASTAVSALSLTSRVRADREPSVRYPDPRVRIIDESFAKYRLNLAKVERIATGMRWSEGPVWFGDGRFLL